jgi:hypothetical protein
MLVYHNHLSGFERQLEPSHEMLCAATYHGHEGQRCTVQRIEMSICPYDAFQAILVEWPRRCFQNMRRHHIVPSADYFDISVSRPVNVGRSVARDTRDGGYENSKT